MPSHRRRVERRRASRVKPAVGVRACAQQQAHALHIALVRRDDERRRRLPITGRRQLQIAQRIARRQQLRDNRGTLSPC